MRSLDRHAFSTGGLVAIVALTIGCNASPDGLSGSAPSGSSTAAALDQATQPADLQARIDHAIDFALNHRHLNARDQAAWQVVHGILCFGRDLQVEHDGAVSGALDYLLQGGTLKGWNLRPTPHGVLAVVESGTKTGQGHPDQWLGYMALAGVKPDEELIVGGKKYHVRDLLTEAQWHLYQGIEATWPLMAFSAYLPLDAKWTAEDGGEWTIDRVAAMEAGQDLRESACGGTHRLVGLLSAVNRFKREHPGEPLTGGFRQADEKIREAFAAAQRNQQPNGRFSTNFFTRPGSSDDLDKQMHATGHTLEFVVLAASDEQLSEPWIERAVVDLVDLLDSTEDFDLECGGLYHAARGLVIYRQRRFGGAPAASESSAPAAPAEAARDDKRR